MTTSLQRLTIPALPPIPSSSPSAPIEKEQRTFSLPRPSAVTPASLLFPFGSYTLNIPYEKLTEAFLQYRADVSIPFPDCLRFCPEASQEGRKTLRTVIERGKRPMSVNEMGYPPVVLCFMRFIMAAHISKLQFQIEKRGKKRDYSDMASLINDLKQEKNVHKLILKCDEIPFLDGEFLEGEQLTKLIGEAKTVNGRDPEQLKQLAYAYFFAAKEQELALYLYTQCEPLRNMAACLLLFSKKNQQPVFKDGYEIHLKDSEGRQHCLQIFEGRRPPPKVFAEQFSLRIYPTHQEFQGSEQAYLDAREGLLRWIDLENAPTSDWGDMCVFLSQGKGLASAEIAQKLTQKLLDATNGEGIKKAAEVLRTSLRDFQIEEPEAVLAVILNGCLAWRFKPQEIRGLLNELKDLLPQVSGSSLLHKLKDDFEKLDGKWIRGGLQLIAYLDPSVSLFQVGDRSAWRIPVREKFLFFWFDAEEMVSLFKCENPEIPSFLEEQKGAVLKPTDRPQKFWQEMEHMVTTGLSHSSPLLRGYARELLLQSVTLFPVRETVHALLVALPDLLDEEKDLEKRKRFKECAENGVMTLYPALTVKDQLTLVNCLSSLSHLSKRDMLACMRQAFASLQHVGLSQVTADLQAKLQGEVPKKEENPHENVSWGSFEQALFSKRLDNSVSFLARVNEITALIKEGKTAVPSVWITLAAKAAPSCGIQKDVRVKRALLDLFEVAKRHLHGNAEFSPAMKALAETDDPECVQFAAERTLEELEPLPDPQLVADLIRRLTEQSGNESVRMAERLFNHLATFPSQGTNRTAAIDYLLCFFLMPADAETKQIWGLLLSLYKSSRLTLGFKNDWLEQWLKSSTFSNENHSISREVLVRHSVKAFLRNLETTAALSETLKEMLQTYFSRFQGNSLTLCFSPDEKNQVGIEIVKKGLTLFPKEYAMQAMLVSCLFFYLESVIVQTDKKDIGELLPLIEQYVFRPMPARLKPLHQAYCSKVISLADERGMFRHQDVKKFKIFFGAGFPANRLPNLKQQRQQVIVQDLLDELVSLPQLGGFYQAVSLIESAQQIGCLFEHKYRITMYQKFLMQFQARMQPTLEGMHVLYDVCSVLNLLWKTPDLQLLGPQVSALWANILEKGPISEDILVRALSEISQINMSWQGKVPSSLTQDRIRLASYLACVLDSFLKKYALDSLDFAALDKFYTDFIKLLQQYGQCGGRNLQETNEVIESYKRRTSEQLKQRLGALLQTHCHPKLSGFLNTLYTTSLHSLLDEKLCEQIFSMLMAIPDRHLRAEAITIWCEHSIRNWTAVFVTNKHILMETKMREIYEGFPELLNRVKIAYLDPSANRT